MTPLMTPVAPRGRCEGLFQILRFNYPMFASAILAAVFGAAILCLVSLPPLLRGSIAALAVAALAWTLSALAVSWYVYDHAPTFRFRWLAPRIGPLRTWANIHAGFDQTTPMLRTAFPSTAGTPIDLYHPAVMTEPSIHRARAAYPPSPGNLSGSYDRLPLKDGSMDVVFMLFAAHELRTPAQRSALFTEAARTLAPGGTLVLLEHPRGLATFLAFGPGAFHFHSRRQWRRAGTGARLTLAQTGPLTPFAFFQIWRKQP